MNGSEIYSFTHGEVQGLINSAMAAAVWGLDPVDSISPHHVNRFILDCLAKRMKVLAEQFVVVHEARDNTSSASIPLAICDWWLRAWPLARLASCWPDLGLASRGVLLRSLPTVPMSGRSSLSDRHAHQSV